MDWGTIAGTAAAGVQLALTAWVMLRTALRRHPDESALSWILLAALLPYAGFVLYLLFGEKPIGRWRAWRLRRILARWSLQCGRRRVHLDDAPRSLPHRGLVILAQRLGRMPMTGGSRITLHETAGAIDGILADIRGARRSIDLEFYLWSPGGRIDDVAAALEDAVRRGVQVRLLLDAVGSHAFLGSESARRLERAGVELRTALPVHWFSPAHGRADLRLHRKTVIVDRRCAWTGSMNLVDPVEFGRSRGVEDGWVDAMARIEGTAVADLAAVFALDWSLQPENPGEDDELPEPVPVPAAGDARIVTVVSGPASPPETNARLLLEAIACARREILISTPYFIPSAPLLLALQNAALRGVAVHVCIPEKSDHRLVQIASARCWEALLDAGAHLHLFHGGLLHTKALCVDEDFALFGTVNMDSRSLHLNGELTLLVLDRPFVASLSKLLRSYLAGSTPLDRAAWRRRGRLARLAEGFCHLFSPVL